MKKKITFQEACQLWLETQRAEKHLATTDINYAVRVTLFAALLNEEEVYHLSADGASRLWVRFERHWLGNEKELDLARPFLKISLLKIIGIMNDWNSGKRNTNFPSNLELPFLNKPKKQQI